MFSLHLSRTTLTLVVACSLFHNARAASEPSRTEILSAMRRAAEFFRYTVAYRGAYVWRYSSDLERREGEGKATKTMAWVQPPGLPSVGEAYLMTYQTTKDSFYLEAAREAAMALVRGQLRSGGWDYRIQYDPDDRRRYDYRVDQPAESGLRNVTTLDDDTTQAALRFLMRLDQQLEFKDSAIHGSVEYALQQLLAVQYPNGAWPQRFSEITRDKQAPVIKATYPDTWSRRFPDRDYREMYTLNDNTLADMIETMWTAFEIYSDERFRRSAEQGGRFLLLAQLPEPQPAWAQQYNRNMHPVWARKFEPPAVTGGESQGALDTLMDLYGRTGNKEFLKPIPSALAYLKRSQLPDGRLARFYELQTNRPLYFTKQYELIYDASDLPTHYSFIVASRVARLEARYEQLVVDRNATVRRRSPRVSARRVQEIIDAMDERGAWVTNGRLRTLSESDVRVIESRTFIEYLGILCEYLAASEVGDTPQ